VAGDKDDTGVRVLSDGRMRHKRGSTVHYLMTVPKPLGGLQYVRVWHDNSGVGTKGSWYLDKIVIKDIQTGET